MARRSSVQNRQREKRRNVRQRILDTCQELLEQRGWSDIPLEDVMARAGLTRTAFYRHFDDRAQLLIALLDELGIEFALTADPWQLAPDDPLEGLRKALRALTQIYERHGRIMRAISDAAGHDPEVAERYQALAGRLVAGVEARLREDIAAGRAAFADAHETARALVWLNERYLTETFGRRPFAAQRAVAEAALFEIWTRALYAPRGLEPAQLKSGQDLPT